MSGGRHDPFFIPAGAEAYQRDVPDVTLVWLGAGHLVPDENTPLAASQIKAVFG